MTGQLGSDARQPPLFEGEAQWETIEELEEHLGEGEVVDPRIAAHVSRATGQDVSGARVHRGPLAVAMAAKRSATAFAVGRHIVMGAAAPAPGTPEGDALLAHELAHTAQQGSAAADPTARKKPIGEEDQAAERDAGLARLGNFASAIGDVMRTGLQLQRCAEIKPAKVTELRGKEAEAKLAELGGRLATNPDYSGGRKAIAGSHIQYQLLSTPSPTTQVGIYQWTHDGPEGYHAQSIPAVGRPDPIPAAAPGPNGMFVNAHNVGATTMPLPKPGSYTTDAWVRAGVDNNGVLEGYELHVPHTVEVVPLASARQDAYGKLAGKDKEDDYQKFHDTMDMQKVLLKPGGSDAQGKGHQHQISTEAANPAKAQPGTLAFEAKDARADKSKALTYHWYVSVQTKDEPPKDLGGHDLVTVSARSGYDFGTGTKIEVPTERAGFWVIWYQAKDETGGDVGEASYLQTILGGDELAQVEKYDKYMKHLDELGGKIEGAKVPLTGVHVSQANANETRLRLFVGKKKGDAGTFLLIDGTPGLDPKANRLEYTSSSGQGVIDEFVSNNKYPKGQMQFRSGANAFGIPTAERTIETSGMGAFDRLSTGLSVGGMAVMGAGLLLAPITRGQSIQVAVVLAGGLTAAGATVSLYERLQHAEVSGTGVALDVAMIASSLISGGTAIRALRSGPAVLLASRTTKFLLWANFAADGVMGLLIATEGVEQLAEIIERKDIPEEAKRAEIVRAVTNLVMASMMIAVSAGQLREFRTKVETALGRKLAGIGDEVVMALAMLDEGTLKTLAPIKDTKEFVKLAGALREEPALINILKSEGRLAKILALMKNSTAEDLRFAIMRANAHEAGVSVANSERLANVLKAASVEPTIAMALPRDMLARLGETGALGELEAVSAAAASGTLKGRDTWMASLLRKQGAELDSALAWGTEARKASAHGGAVLDLSGTDAATNAVVKERSDLRGQMELKNQKLATDGQPARYPDLDASVNTGMDNLAAARKRGFPYGFKDKATFEGAGKKLKAEIAGLPAPATGKPIPANKIAVQGSAVHNPTAKDVDIAVLVSPDEFNQLLEQSFPKEVAKVRARGIDPFKMTAAQGITANERTLGRAAEVGKLNRSVVKPSMSDIRKNLADTVGTDIDLSIIRTGGPFDHGPYFPFP